jgi:hypothetical protein
MTVCEQDPGHHHISDGKLVHACDVMMTDLSNLGSGDLHLADSSITSNVLEGQPDPAFI